MRDTCAKCGKDRVVYKLKDDVTLVCVDCFINSTETELRKLIEDAT